MPATHCAVPNCNWSSKKAKQGNTRTLFTVYRPEFAKTNDEKEHREQLTNFLLSVRDAGKGDCIKEMLHKETAAICEAHFDQSDLNRSHGSGKYVKLHEEQTLQTSS
ncbi:uncharacterized protein LOC144745144 [Ciona intestinalis]